MQKVEKDTTIRRNYRFVSIVCACLFLFHVVLLVSGISNTLYSQFNVDADTVQLAIEGPFVLGLLSCVFYIFDQIKLRSVNAYDRNTGYKMLVYITGFIFLAGVVLWAMNR